MEMLGVEPVPTQVVPPLPPTETSMDLALVGSGQADIVPTTVENAIIPGENLEVAIVRTMANPDRSSSIEEVEGGLKRKNSYLTQKSTTTVSGATGKKEAVGE